MVPTSSSPLSCGGVSSATDSLPAGGCVLAVNHLHWVDICVVGATSPRTIQYVAKREAFELPIAGWYIGLHGVEDIAQVIAETGAELGLLAVPSEAAQPVADALIAAGIRGLLNFAPVMLRVPPEVRLVSVDLTVQLEQLAFQVQAGGADGMRADEPLISTAAR